MTSCATKNCPNHESRSLEERITEGVSYHLFPEEPELREKWVKQMNQDDFQPGPESALCSLHFNKESYIVDSDNVAHLKADAIPTVFEFETMMEVDGAADGDDTIRCCAYKCTNTYQENSPITFHPFPVDQPDLCDQWLIAMNVTQIVATKAVLCSEHFDESCFITGDDGQRLIIADAVPSLFSFPEEEGEEGELKQAGASNAIDLPAQITENGEGIELTDELLDLIQRHDSLVTSVIQEGDRLMKLVQQRKALEQTKDDTEYLLRLVLRGGPVDRAKLRNLGPLIRSIDEMGQQMWIECMAPCIPLAQQEPQDTPE